MAKLSDIENAVAELLRVAAPEREVVQGRRGEGAEPGVPFAMWNSTFTLSGRPTVTHTLDTTTVSQSADVDFTISFDGADAMDAAQQFGLLWWIPARYQDIFKLCGFMGITGPIDLSEPQLAKYQTRADLHVLLSATLERVETSELVTSDCITVVAPDKEPAYTDTNCISGSDCDGNSG